MEFSRITAQPCSVAAQLQWSRDGAHLFAIGRDGSECILEAATLSHPAVPACPWFAPHPLAPDARGRAVIRDGKLEILPHQ